MLIHSTHTHLFTGSVVAMSEASDSQNKSEEQVNLSEGTSPSGSYDEGSRSTLKNLPKAATRQIKKTNSDSEDEDFVIEEEVTSKKKVLKKEYVAAASGACQAVWLSRLLASLTGDEADQVTLKVDNQSAIALSKNPVHHERSKHIDIMYHYVRECVENGTIAVEYVRTVDQLADVLTKPLGKLKSLELRDRIGMRTLEQILQG